MAVVLLVAMSCELAVRYCRVKGADNLAQKNRPWQLQGPVCI